MVQRSDGLGGCKSWLKRSWAMRKSTYNFGMVRFGTENLDVVEFNDFHSAVLRSLAGRGSDVFVDDEFAEAPRGAVQEEVALLVVLAHDDRDFS
jgi:hypothetical protein